MFKQIFIIILMSFSTADVYEQKKILIINNLSKNILFDSPVLKSINVNYPKKIKPNDQGLIEIDIQKDWWLENPLDAMYRQKVFFDDAFITFGLKKRVPNPGLTEPFEPGYDCVVDASGAKNIINVSSFNKSNAFCAAFYLY